MRTFLLFLALVLTGLQARAQTSELYNFRNSQDSLIGIVRFCNDAQGNHYYLGGASSWENSCLVPRGYLIKTDITGQVVYAKDYPTDMLLSILEMAADNTGNLYLYTGDQVIRIDASGSNVWRVGIRPSAIIPDMSRYTLRLNATQDLIYAAGGDWNSPTLFVCNTSGELVMKSTLTTTLTEFPLMIGGAGFEIKANGNILGMAHNWISTCYFYEMDLQGSILWVKSFDIFDNIGFIPYGISKVNEDRYLVSGMKYENTAGQVQKAMLCVIDGMGNILSSRRLENMACLNEVSPAGGNFLLSGNTGDKEAVLKADGDGNILEAYIAPAPGIYFNDSRRFYDEGGAVSRQETEHSVVHVFSVFSPSGCMAFLPYTVTSTQPDLALKQIDGELYTLHDLPDTAYSLFSLTPTFAVREIKCSSNALPVGEEEQPGFRVYPTVVTQMLTVESDNDFQSVMICDLAGKKVLEQKGNFSQLLTLDLSHLSRGSYLVAVNGGPSGRRIIKVE